jgi:hypothetical protein
MLTMKDADSYPFAAAAPLCAIVFVCVLWGQHARSPISLTIVKPHPLLLLCLCVADRRRRTVTMEQGRAAPAQGTSRRLVQQSSDGRLVLGLATHTLPTYPLQRSTSALAPPQVKALLTGSLGKLELILAAGMNGKIKQDFERAHRKSTPAHDESITKCTRASFVRSSRDPRGARQQPPQPN